MYCTRHEFHLWAFGMHGVRIVVSAEEVAHTETQNAS